MILDRPIILEPTEVRAVLSGTKTTLRRLAWGEAFPILSAEHDHFIDNGFQVERYQLVTNIPERGFGYRAQGRSIWQKMQSGSLLWVREHFARTGGGPVFTATHKTNTWDAPILHPNHMSRALSRLTLRITATRIERLLSITEAEAQAEGVERDFFELGRADLVNYRMTVPHGYRGGFLKHWRERCGAQSIEDNPEVVVLIFEAHEKNIDSMPVPALVGAR